MYTFKYIILYIYLNSYKHESNFNLNIKKRNERLTKIKMRVRFIVEEEETNFD